MSEPRVVRPPYAPVKGVQEFFESIASRSRPERVDKRFLEAVGVSAGNEQHLVSALKFLGLIDSNGLPCKAFDVLYLKGPERQSEFQTLLRSAYRGVFSRLDLQTTTRLEIHDVFVREYALRGQLARKASALFVLLCSLAGFVLSRELAGSHQRRAAGRAAGPHRAKQPAIREVPSGRDVSIGMSPVPSCPAILVTLHPEMGEDEMVAFLRRVRRAIQRADGDE